MEQLTDLPTVLRGLKAKVLQKPVPIKVVYEITHGCNLACQYCDRHKLLPNEMPFEQISQVIDQFVELGMRSMTLDGGEPFTHPEIEQVVNKLSDLGILISVNTNAILIPRKKDIMKKFSLVNVSIDGLEEDHDIMRGRGSFQKALKGIKRAKEEGLFVKLRCTLHKYNLKSVPQLLALAQELTCPIVFQPALNSLFLDTDRDGSTWEVSPSEFHSTIIWLIMEKRKSPYIGNHYASLKHFLSYPNDEEPPCSAGWVHVTMDPEGYLYHCGQINRAKQKINVLEYGVKEAFKKIARYSCGQCWCAGVVDANYAWGLEFSKFTRLGLKSE